MNRIESPEINPHTKQATNQQQRRQDSTMWQRQSLQQTVLGKLDKHVQKNEIRSFLNPIHKNKLKMD